MTEYEFMSKLLLYFKNRDHPPPPPPLIEELQQEYKNLKNKSLLELLVWLIKPLFNSNVFEENPKIFMNIMLIDREIKNIIEFLCEMVGSKLVKSVLIDRSNSIRTDINYGIVDYNYKLLPAKILMTRSATPNM